MSFFHFSIIFSKNILGLLSAINLPIRLVFFPWLAFTTASHREVADLFIEMGLTEAGDTSPNSGGETANVIFTDVLPHYFKALEPAVKKPSQPKPEVTVTLVRWPYT